MIVIYTKPNCPYCRRAKHLLQSKGINLTEIDVSTSAELFEQMQRHSGRRTVPQIFIGDHHIGGCDDLLALDQAQNLDPLLENMKS